LSHVPCSIRAGGVDRTAQRAREARKSRNPRSGAPVLVAAKTAAQFKAGKEMRRRLNPPR
jgi:nucleoid DNA-binding protein